MLTIHDTRNDFSERPCTTAVLPVGAVEQHGKHLPVGTDLMLAEAFAERVAAKLDAYLLPPLAITASIEHRKAKGTVYLRAETLAAVVRDIACSLRQSGFRRLILANFHVGNWILKPTIRELNRDLADFRAILLAPELPLAVAQEIFAHVSGDIHGGEGETSLVLHLYPQEVRPLPPPAERTFPPQPLLDYFDSTELAADGFWGWPEAATAEKGRRAFEQLVDSSLRFVQQIEEMGSHVSEPGKSGIVLRGFRADDIAFAHRVRQLAGWNQTEQDWRGYLEFEPEGCFIAEVRQQRAGTATTIRYGDRFGWIGMVLVHPDRRRLGVGTELLRHAIAYLQRAGVSSIKLDATPMGKKVYGPMGFVDEYEILRYDGIAPSVPSDAPAELSPFLPGDIEAVARFDAPVFGADRAHVLRALRGRNPEWCFITRNPSGITGYLIAREGAAAIQVGPWMARDSVSAASLLRAFFGRVAGRRVFVDVPAPNPLGGELMQKHGFTVQRTLTRMYLGQKTYPGTPYLNSIYSTGGPEKG